MGNEGRDIRHSPFYRNRLSAMKLQGLADISLNQEEWLKILLQKRYRLKYNVSIVFLNSLRKFGIIIAIKILTIRVLTTQASSLHK